MYDKLNQILEDSKKAGWPATIEKIKAVMQSESIQNTLKDIQKRKSHQDPSDFKKNLAAWSEAWFVATQKAPTKVKPFDNNFFQKKEDWLGWKEATAVWFGQVYNSSSPEDAHLNQNLATPLTQDEIFSKAMTSLTGEQRLELSNRTKLDHYHEDGFVWEVFAKRSISAYKNRQDHLYHPNRINETIKFWAEEVIKLKLDDCSFDPPSSAFHCEIGWCDKFWARNDRENQYH